MDYACRLTNAVRLKEQQAVIQDAFVVIHLWPQPPHNGNDACRWTVAAMKQFAMKSETDDLWELLVMLPSECPQSS
jgi:hypothetical protein